jgi:hypothetical protein
VLIGLLIIVFVLAALFGRYAWLVTHLFWAVVALVSLVFCVLMLVGIGITLFSAASP